MFSSFSQTINKHKKICAILQVRFHSRNSGQFKTDIKFAIEKRLLEQALVKPVLNPKNIKKLKESFSLRKYVVDFDHLNKCFKDFIKAQKACNKLTRHIAQLKSTEEDGVNLELDQRIKKNETMKRELLRNEKYLYQILSANILRLPNILHPDTTSNHSVIKSFYEKPSLEFTPKSHMEIGLHNSEIEVIGINPSLFYLRKNLPLLEIAYSDFFTSKFTQNGFIMQSNPSIWRPIMFESCGQDHHDIDRSFCLKKQMHYSYEYDLYLSGGASPHSFAAHFCRGIISSDSLPVKLVTIGKHYEPNDNLSLYNAIQTTAVDAFIPCTEEMQNEEFNNVLDLLTALYEDIGLHFRLIRYGVTSLANFESGAVGIEIFSPAVEEYIEVARVSFLEDYVSKRIIAKYENAKLQLRHFHMVYVKVVNVSYLIGLTLENYQHSDKSYDIPKCIQSHEIFNAHKR